MQTPAFIHSQLDTANLSLSEFRVFCHVVRVANGLKGSCFETLDTMANTIGCHVRTVRPALKRLCEKGMLSRRFNGSVNEYRVLPIEEWKEAKAVTKSVSSALTKIVTPEISSPNKNFPSALTKNFLPTYKEGVPLKVIQNPSRNYAQEIYSEYPRKVAEPVAIKAIERALKRHDPAMLLERTKAFAKLWGSDLKYCPHPTTWFNQERYNDDPSTWGGKRKPSETIFESLR